MQITSTAIWANWHKTKTCRAIFSEQAAIASACTQADATEPSDLATMHIPTAIKLHKASRILELRYGEQSFNLSAEFLRVHSPSAEVQGHGQPVLQYGKQNVALTALQPAGNYALKLVFDDGHDSGLFTWDYLYQLATRQQQLWEDYLQALHDAGRSRDPQESIVRLML
jgi:DUF971 family protein